MWFLWGIRLWSHDVVSMGDKIMEPSYGFYRGVRLWSHHVVSMGG